ncbi:MAG TPA: SpvB/TcaC N-terminal domain-containing protein, partial [Polyangium sp.]|nr:SpvB/TcaC N-terminal domain-containing protein [Polyangium sp.]
MLSTNRGIWQALIPLWFFLVSVFAPSGCSCGPEGQAQSNKILPCVPQHAGLAISPPLQSKTIVPGTLPASFAVTDSGNASLTMPLVVPPGRAGMEPSLAITYDNSGGDGVMGMGFSVSGASAITRCPKTMAIDGEIRAVQYDSDDAVCLDGKRLVSIAQHGDLIEYRTFPDSQVKVIQHVENGEGSSYFEAFLSSGWIVEYGLTAGTRPLARNGAPRAWLATETRDVRGNSINYGYCFAESEEGFVVEYALDELRYGTRAVSFVYGTKDPDDVRTVYSGGMAIQNALRLDELQTRVDDELVRRYEFSYEQSETTGRTRLTSVQECGADGACKPETRYQYANVRKGFEHVAATTAAPMSKRSSPMLADFNGDGLDDLLTPDTTSISTPDHPITEWRIARNVGNTFAAPNVAFLQEWSVLQNPQGPSDPALLQPELGVAIDYDQNGTTDVLLYDVYGNRN